MRLRRSLCGTPIPGHIDHWQEDQGEEGRHQQAPHDGEGHGPPEHGREGDVNAARLTTYLEDENIRGYGDRFIQTDAAHPMTLVADLIKEKGWERKSLGLEMDQIYCTHRACTELAKALPGATIKDGNLLINKVRHIKSKEEIRFMEIAGSIAVKVMETAIDRTEVGTRQCDLAAAIAQAQYQGTATHGGDYPAIVPLIMVGRRTMAAHLTWTDEKLRKDDPVIVELCGVYKRYHAIIARTLYLGTPPKPLVDVADTIIGGLRQTLDFIKPGLTCEDVEAKWRQLMGKSRILEGHRIGYTIGLSYPPFWGEQSMDLRNGDKSVLEPNMTFHLVPGIWQKDLGFEVDASIRITENGCEPLFEFPYDLIRK